MSLPSRLYQCYKKVANCELVKTRNATPENMKEFEALLNEANPQTAEETAMKTMVRACYNSSQPGFIRYVTIRENLVQPLILWTESKRIAKYFHLIGVVFLMWDENASAYVVSPARPRTKAATDAAGTVSAANAPATRKVLRVKRVLRRPTERTEPAAPEQADSTGTSE